MRHRRPRPRFKKGTTIEERIKMILEENGIEIGPFQAKRIGVGGCIYYIWVNGSAIGHYDQLHHTLQIYDFIE